MAAPIGFKQRVHLTEVAGASVRIPRLPAFSIPVVGYWLLCAGVIHGVSTGSMDLEQWLDRARRLPAALSAPPAPDVAPPRSAPSRPIQHHSRFDLRRRDPVAASPGGAPVRRAFASMPTSASATPWVLPTALEAAPEAELSSMPLDPAPAVAMPEVDEPVVGRGGLAVLPLEPSGDEPETLRRATPEPTIEAPPAPPAAVPSAPDRPDAPPLPPAVYSSCEAAMDAARQEIDLHGRSRAAPDLPRAAFSRVLDHGGYLLGCGIPDRTSVDVCAAIQHGRAVGVTVATRPASERMQRCVAAAVRRLTFPSSPKLDVARTHFGAAR